MENQIFWSEMEYVFQIARCTLSPKKPEYLPPPGRPPRIFTTARVRTAIKVVDYEYASFSQGKAPWGRGHRFPLG